MIRRAFAGASASVFKLLYKLQSKEVRSDEIVFLSRQTDRPSYDFQELAKEFERRGWKVTMHLKKVSGRTMVAYVAHVLREIALLARCKAAVLDRYDPVVSLLDFECDIAGASAGKRADRSRTVCNLDFPRKPVILQMWHAFGAFKKFGFQSVGTPEGHSASFTSAFNIHRNYSWVMCSGEGARAAFAEAFSCPQERVVALDRPEYDELRLLRAARDDKLSRREAGAKRTVLMAPTLRINKDSAHPFRDLYTHRGEFENSIDAEIVWSFHPLETGLPAPGNVSERLLDCDVVVTDYSSIVYEAYLLGVPVLFYVPDIADYRESPGLNADPSKLCPELCAFDEREIVRTIARVVDDAGAYQQHALERFAGSAFEIGLDRQAGSAAARIADFLIGHVQ